MLGMFKLLRDNHYICFIEDNCVPQLVIVSMYTLKSFEVQVCYL